MPFTINGLYIHYSVLSSRCFRSACTGVHTHYTHTIVPEKTTVSNMDEHSYRVIMDNVVDLKFMEDPVLTFTGLLVIHSFIKQQLYASYLLCSLHIEMTNTCLLTWRR